MKKSVYKFLLGILLVTILMNYRVVTNPSEELADTLSNRWVFEWHVDLLLWRGADVTYNNYQPYHLMLIRKHYHLIEKFGNEIPVDKRMDVYQISQIPKLDDAIKLRIKKSLLIE